MKFQSNTVCQNENAEFYEQFVEGTDPATTKNSSQQSFDTDGWVSGRSSGL